MQRYVYSDGSAPDNGSSHCVAGWAAIEVTSDDVTLGNIVGTKSGILYPEKGKKKPTSIRAELTGAIAALSFTNPGDEVTFYSDSAYVINGLTQKWYLKWRRTGKNSLGKEPENMDLWNQLIDLLESRTVLAKHVKGHSGHRFQEMCDTLAVTRAREGKLKYDSTRR